MVRGPELLARLFTEHVDAVFGFLVTRCGSRSVAEDVAGETFAEAARAFSVGRGDGIGRGWLIDVAKKRLIDHWRRERRHLNRVDRLIQFAPTDPETDGHDGDTRLLEALDTLPSRQRAVLMLRYLDGYSVSDVADALETTYQATESLLARARRSLLVAYEEMT